MADAKWPTWADISAAMMLWYTSEPGSEREQEAGSRMARLLGRFRENAERELAANTQKPQSEVRTLFSTREFQQKHGAVRLEEWPEGIVLWADGEIRWKSWSGVGPVEYVTRYLKGLGIRDYRVSEMMPRLVVVLTPRGALTERQREVLRALPSMQGVRLAFEEVAP